MRRIAAPKGLRPGEVSGRLFVKRPKIEPGRLHRHGCTQCGHFYDDACDVPGENARCGDCNDKYGPPHGRPIWHRNMDPRDCCRRQSRPATFDEYKTYSLAGDGEWWICGSCARTHPYDPTDPRSNP